MKQLVVAIFFVSSFLTSVAPANAQQNEYLQILDVLEISEIREALLAAPDHGLDPSKYWGTYLENQFQNDPSSVDLKQRAKAAYLRYLQHLNQGVVNPAYLGKDFDIRQKKFVDPSQLSALVLIQGHSAFNLVTSFAPQSAPYRSLQEALRRISTVCTEGQWQPLPTFKKALKLNSTDSTAVLPIKIRLAQLGYAISNFDQTFDRQTLQAIQDVQITLKFKPDGVISPNGKTWKYLNTPCEARMEQIKVDMEKLRWFPREFGNRYIYVNLAHNYLHVFDKDIGVSKVMNTITGRNARKTPTMIDQVTYITINPYWVVPPTVFKEDKVSDLRQLSYRGIQNYFFQHNYEVWDQKFKNRINPGSINWFTAGANSKFYIRQKPGLHNALGVLKFNLTNDDAIYLHDTNQRYLFSEYDRNLSSGCVRVEKPFDLAEILLANTEWTYDRIQSVAAKPGEVPNKNTNVKLKDPMPVYMLLQTSTLTSDGVIRFSDDVYQQGDMIRAEMR